MKGVSRNMQDKKGPERNGRRNTPRKEWKKARIMEGRKKERKDGTEKGRTEERKDVPIPFCVSSAAMLRRQDASRRRDPTRKYNNKQADWDSPPSGFDGTTGWMS